MRTASHSRAQNSFRRWRQRSTCRQTQAKNPFKSKRAFSWRKSPNKSTYPLFAGKLFINLFQAAVFRIPILEEIDWASWALFWWRNGCPKTLEFEKRFYCYFFSFLKLYTTMPVTKLAAFMELDQNVLMECLLCFKHKMHNIVWTKGVSSLDGEFQAGSEVRIVFKDVEVLVSLKRHARSLKNSDVGARMRNSRIF